ncbi:MAG: ABC transporter ATP-binding protein [Peptoniphilus sp.]|nr:ABC transporter ATP-binding protein [Peptoniphilus sp.]MDY3118718.1 ABC transporter ATP-binding protein [Peptoniphilus sp.]
MKRMGVEDLRFSIQIVLEYSVSYVIIVLFANLVLALAGPATVYLYQRMVNGFQMMESFHYLLFLVLIYVVLLFSVESLNLLLEYYKKKTAMGFDLYMRSRWLSKISKLTLSEMEDSEIKDALGILEAQGSGYLLHIIEMPIVILSSAVAFTSYFYILSADKPWLLGFGIVPGFLKYLIDVRLDQKIFSLAQKRAPSYRKIWYIQSLFKEYRYTKELKVLGIYPFLLRRFERLQKRYNQEKMALNKKSTCVYFLINSIEFMCMGLAFAFVIKDAIEGQLLAGTCLAYLQSFMQAKEQFEHVLEGVGEIKGQSYYANHLRRFFDFKEEEDRGVEIPRIREIAFRHVSFRYPKAENDILYDVSFHVKRGDVIAIVGENGSGKTTLIKLLMGLYDDYEGVISVDERNLRDIKKVSFREKIACVFQDYIKFESSIRWNITSGNEEIVERDDCLKAGLARVGLTDWMEKENICLDTQVGSLFKDGVQLSIGQWQRLALARAWMKQADVYIFDEPNASQDGKSAEKIWENIMSYRKSGIVIIVTHSLKILKRNIDKILYIDNGRVLCSSKHEDLLNYESYRKLWKEA